MLACQQITEQIATLVRLKCWLGAIKSFVSKPCCGMHEEHTWCLSKRLITTRTISFNAYLPWLDLFRPKVGQYASAGTVDPKSRTFAQIALHLATFT